MTDTATRLEHDLLGDKAVPADAYYGVQTARALENFHISGVELKLYPNLIKAFAMVKMAASASLWTATTVFAVCMPTRCWIAPESPSAT